MAAFVMLVIFTLSITPKLYLHAIFAHHTDIVYKKTDSGKTQVSKNGFACDCNNQVATSPFTEPGETPKIGALTIYQLYLLHFTSEIITNEQFYFELRGPPSYSSVII